MIQDRHDERTPPMTPQLALRVAIVGTCALVMFAIIFFRLWYLQVLSGSKYVSEAAVNFVRSVPVQAPRGEILDRNGNVMVGSRLVPVVDISPASLPVPVSLADGNVLHQPHADFVLYRKLATVLGISTKPQPCRIQVIENGKHPRLPPAAGVHPVPGRAGRLAGVLRERDDQDRRPHRCPGLPARAPAAVSRRRHAAGVAAPLSAGDDRGAAVRDRRPDHGARDTRPALQGRSADRHGRTGGPRVRVQPVPAGPRRLREGDRQRPGSGREDRPRQVARSPART